MITGRSLSLRPIDDGFVELRFDRHLESVNKFDTETIDELQEAIDYLAKRGGVKGLLVTSAKPAFIVGADIFQLNTLFRRPISEIAATISHQAAIFTAFEDLPIPTVAALNGMVLGGGFEFALTADYRIAEPSTEVGLPEVTLGIIPGYGGTVRLPRLIDCAVAASWIISGKRHSAASAKSAGAVNAIVDLPFLRDQAIDLLRKTAKSGEWRERRRARKGAIPGFDINPLSTIKADAARRSRHFPAALAAVEQIEATAHLDRDAALRLEAEVIAALAKTPAAASLIQSFINGQFLKKKVGAYAREGRPIERAGILGAGIMGGGIAFTSASQGIPAILKDIAQGALDLGLQEANNLLSRQVSQGRMTEDKAGIIRNAIEARLDYQGFNAVDLVVEAVVENMAVKKAVLTEVEKAIPDGAILVSNTSSLSIGALAESLMRPENFAGMHFFNPVPLMPLVEVIRGPKTTDATIATVAGYATHMGKTPIVVSDCPGFLVNRILFSGIAGFLMLLREGADYRQIDHVMEGQGWPMGFAYLHDVIGLDTCVSVTNFITAGYGSRMALGFRHAVECLTAAGRLGQKSGAGFYRYTPGDKGRLVKQVDSNVEALLQSCQHNGRRPFSDDEIFDRLMLPLVSEAALCLSEGVAESAAEIDMAMIMGISFPRHLGGPLKYADLLGAQSIVRRLEDLAHLGPLYSPPQSLRDLAAGNGQFYPAAQEIRPPHKNKAENSKKHPKNPA